MNSRVSIAMLLAAAACGPSVEPSGEPGKETGECIDNQCLGAELQCLSNLCVDPNATPEATAGDDGSGDGDGDGGSDETAGPGGEPVTSVSVLFVIDNSGSMAEEQASLAAAIQSLLDPLVASGLDIRIGLTTTDNGNPWCEGTSPEGGKLVLTSCRSRTQDFVFSGAMALDATQETCLDICPQTWTNIQIEPTASEVDAEIKPRPWIESVQGVTNLPVGLSTIQALQCFLPQGINGCGFEEHLESMHKSISRAALAGEEQHGFLPEGALLAVVVVTDEVDCSFNKDHETIFLPDGNRVFWSDPDASAPSSAVCWNAGVQCSGGPGTYADCQPVDLDVNGNPAATEDDAVLRPLSRYIDGLSTRPVYFAAITGVGTDGSVTYADTQADPTFQGDFGIGAGCQSAAGVAVPPVRIRAVAEALEPDSRRLFSVCSDDYGATLSAIAEGILDAAQP